MQNSALDNFSVKVIGTMYVKHQNKMVPVNRHLSNNSLALNNTRDQNASLIQAANVEALVETASKQVSRERLTPFQMSLLKQGADAQKGKQQS